MQYDHGTQRRSDMRSEPLTRTGLASVYFGAALVLSSMAHDLGLPPLVVAVLGSVLVIAPMVRQ
jgi:hypothetical protein